MRRVTAGVDGLLGAEQWAETWCCPDGQWYLRRVRAPNAAERQRLRRSREPEASSAPQLDRVVMVEGRPSALESSSPAPGRAPGFALSVDDPLPPPA
jgi:hypothetical protein